ncbi:hypothetical protein CSQ96_14555 [Janthinobacterium sp. BJB412]|nr:hypothetical protein CSQ96_14555 [Janthinobacterium sp. BJB412]
MDGAGAGAGAAAALPGAALVAGLAGALGRYSGPGWPQPLSRADRHRMVPINSAGVDFTIRILV